MTDSEILLRIAVAALGGLAVGIEREWSARADRDHSRFGGVRTFLLLGLAGGLGATLAAEASPAFGIAAAAGAVLLVAIAYAISALQGTIDATTEVAGVVVVAAGVLAGSGRLAVASAVFAGVALVLVEKSGMHRAVERIRSEELAAAARFAVLALVVLPLLPNEPIAWLSDLSARKLWGLVLLFAGLSFAGYLAMRAAGAARGYTVTGLLGGIVSSTAVTFNFARESREKGADGGALARGALAASLVMPLRVTVVSAALAPRVALALAPAVALPVLAGAVAVALDLRRHAGEAHGGHAPREPGNPLRLGGAIQMTALFALVLAALPLLRERLGELGVLGGATILGLTDLDALTLTMSRLATSAAGGTGVELAARALVVGMVSNTLFKLAVTLALGDAAFRRLCGAGLALLGLVLAGGGLLVGRL